jgi:hypothetical protein
MGDLGVRSLQRPGFVESRRVVILLERLVHERNSKETRFLPTSERPTNPQRELSQVGWNRRRRFVLLGRKTELGQGLFGRLRLIGSTREQPGMLVGRRHPLHLRPDQI